jgi:hypothetical protein
MVVLQVVVDVHLGALPLAVREALRRDLHLRPHAEALFTWIELEYPKVRDQRGPLRSALGYGVRQKDALLRVLDDGRLILDNNRSERALRGSIATGRKAWLFVGSDDHAQSAGHLFSLIASCKLHRLDAETDYSTWTPSPGNNENLPVNCINWYRAYAFCTWDGGFLP